LFHYFKWDLRPGVFKGQQRPAGMAERRAPPLAFDDIGASPAGWQSPVARMPDKKYELDDR
jgi:hypothetical protein